MKFWWHVNLAILKNTSRHFDLAVFHKFWNVIKTLNFYNFTK